MSTPAVGASPITNILLARHIQGRPQGESFVATSLPGHLLHYIICGRVSQQCNGRQFDLEPGRVLWYHEDEWVEGTVLEAPWHFYSINFIAPSLAPPPEAARLITPRSADVQTVFADIVATFNDELIAPQTRLLRLHSRLVYLLELLLSQTIDASTQPTEESQLWWEIETRVRRNLDQPLDLRQLETWSGCSAATIAREAHAAVGEPPMRRIKRIRLSFARGLVRGSNLTFSEIAARIGYPRVHEFSRDYKQWFGSTPTHDRRRLEVIE